MSPSSGRPRPLVRPAVQPHLEILHTVAATVSRTLDVDDVLRTAVEALTRVTGHEIASLHLLSEDGGTLHLRGERGMSPGLRAVNQMLPVGQGLIGRVAVTGRTVRVEKNYADPDLLPAARAAVRRERIRGFVCVPINSRGRVLGTLSLGRKILDPFEGSEVALLEATADQIGLALDNARLYSETRRQLEELRRTQTQLIHAEKLSAVGKLASGGAHELNNPLTTILGQAHLVLADAELKPALRERLPIIAAETSRAARHV